MISYLLPLLLLPYYFDGNRAHAHTPRRRRRRRHGVQEAKRGTTRPWSVSQFIHSFLHSSNHELGLNLDSILSQCACAEQLRTTITTNNNNNRSSSQPASLDLGCGLGFVRYMSHA
jgi:hypothetical protein